ncbi:hypothetical protein A2U01_0106301 [Trifolium medium]|uniref:Uncharacterized protein n=1 Tax=Trifolium medium TaxID=97028 RepID=A0A392VC82_9FABA|nr:hypothetical protein [Trifolium medium]
MELLAERGSWSLSELVASARSGSPVTMFLSDFGRYCSLSEA